MRLQARAGTKWWFILGHPGLCRSRWLEFAELPRQSYSFCFFCLWFFFFFFFSYCNKSKRCLVKVCSCGCFSLLFCMHKCYCRKTPCLSCVSSVAIALRNANSLLYSQVLCLVIISPNVRLLDFCRNWWKIFLKGWSWQLNWNKVCTEKEMPLVFL